MMIWHSMIESDSASGRGRSRCECLIGERLAALPTTDIPAP